MIGIWNVTVNYNQYISENDTTSWKIIIKLDSSNNLEQILETKPPGSINKCWSRTDDKYKVNWDESSNNILIKNIISYIISIILLCICFSVLSISCIIYYRGENFRTNSISNFYQIN